MMKNKAVQIILFFSGILCFAFGVATAHGWNPSFPTAQAAMVESSIPVIPQDTPTNIEVDGELAVVSPTPARIQLSEVVIAVPKTKISTPNPGAARRRQVQQESQVALESVRETVRKTSRTPCPTGLASDEALSYQPFKTTSQGYTGHGVRGPRLKATERAFSQPSRGLQKPERETYIIDAK
jgi:hypothetical protein